MTGRRRRGSWRIAAAEGSISKPPPGVVFAPTPPTRPLCEHGYPSSHWIGLPIGNDPDGFCRGPAAARTDGCPLRCGYHDPIAACVRLHLIQHHDYRYVEAQEAYPDE